MITGHSQNRIDGRIRLARRKLLFFSIPYDKGWSATVDGRAARLRLVNIGFMGLPLDAGEHEVELRFTPPLRKPGAIVSLAGLAVYGFLFAVWRNRIGAD